MKLNICFYATERGDEPVKDYLDQISENDAAGIVAFRKQSKKTPKKELKLAKERTKKIQNL